LPKSIGFGNNTVISKFILSYHNIVKNSIILIIFIMDFYPLFILAKRYIFW